MRAYWTEERIEATNKAEKDKICKTRKCQSSGYYTMLELLNSFILYLINNKWYRRYFHI